MEVLIIFFLRSTKIAEKSDLSNKSLFYKPIKTHHDFKSGGFLFDIILFQSKESFRKQTLFY